jgi:small subunit ribosomal protein S12
LSTITQNDLKKKKFKKRYRSAAITKCPQRKGDVIRPKIVTPKKPNSARRPVVKASLSNGKFVVAHIPGIGHNLRKHSDILVRGGGCRDLPGVRHTCVRGVLDFLGVKNKTKRRSIYGVKRPQHKITKLRRKFRAMFNQ